MADLLISLGTDEAAAYNDLETLKEIWDKIKVKLEIANEIEAQKKLPSLHELRVSILEYQEGYAEQHVKLAQRAMYSRYKQRKQRGQHGGKPKALSSRDENFRREVESLNCHKREHIAKNCQEKNKREYNSARNTNEPSLSTSE